MIRIASIFLFFILFSCDVVKRHNRLVKRYPFVHKTEVIHDTLYITNSTSDTVTHYNTLLDTIHIREKQLDVKVYRVRDSVFIEGECKDTLVVNEYNQYSSQEPPFNWNGFANKIMILLVLLVAVLILFNILRGKFNR